MDSPIFGIDGGGTGCRAAVCAPDGRRLGEGRSGPANIMTGFATARDNIVEACLKALANAGVPEDSLADGSAFLGVAGANIGNYANEISAALPFRKCTVDTDAKISLQGAIGNEDGIVAIIGTGSVFVSRRGGEIRTAGGWGFVVGDLGSGARLGRDLLEEALLAHDGVRELTPITHHVLDDFRNNPQTIVEYAHAAKPGDFGRFAPLVLDYVAKEDETAMRIWRRSVESVEETLSAMVGSESDRLCLLGGLGQRYGEHLSARFTAMIRPPLGSALDGAVALALKQYAKAEAG